MLSEATFPIVSAAMPKAAISLMQAERTPRRVKYINNIDAILWHACQGSNKCRFEMLANRDDPKAAIAVRAIQGHTSHPGFPPG